MSKISSTFRDITLSFERSMSPRVRSQKLAAYALDKITEAKKINAGASGELAPHRQIVDGKEGAPLASVRPEGIIIARFDLESELLEWIGEQLLLASPRLSGRYMQSHVLTVRSVDGEDIVHDPKRPLLEGEWYVFTNTQPYARKIEPREKIAYTRNTTGDRRQFTASKKMASGQSDQAPDGVYHAIAATAAKRFGNIARIYYVLEFSQSTGVRQPCINVRPY